VSEVAQHPTGRVAGKISLVTGAAMGIGPRLPCGWRGKAPRSSSSTIEADGPGRDGTADQGGGGTAQVDHGRT